VLELKTAWHDGTRELVFEPLELLERLAAMTPRPETNLLICHSLLAPRARWRERVVAYGRVEPAPMAPRPPAGPGGAAGPSIARAWSWAALLLLPTLHCPAGGVRIRALCHLRSLLRDAPLPEREGMVRD